MRSRSVVEARFTPPPDSFCTRTITVSAAVTSAVTVRPTVLTPKLLQFWTACRRRGYEGPESLHALESRQPLTPPVGTLPHALPVVGHSLPGLGTSPLSAVLVGLEMGYERILLAGVPLDDSGHYFDPSDIHTNRFHQDYKHQERDLMYWKSAMKEFKGRVKSLSGNTRTLLGGPEDWNR